LRPTASLRKARVRVAQLIFGPNTPFVIAYRISGPDPNKLREIAADARKVLEANPHDAHREHRLGGERTPTLHFSLQQDRLQAVGADVERGFRCSSSFSSRVFPSRRSARTFDRSKWLARSAGETRLDPARIADFTLIGSAGQRVPLSQVGTVELRMEDPIIRRRDRSPTITVRGDVAEGLQPPDVSAAVLKELGPVINRLPAGYRIEEAGITEESRKASNAILPLFPIMIALTLLIIIIQVRSMSAMGHGVRDGAARSHRRRSHAADLPPAVRHQRARRAHRALGHLDAQTRSFCSDRSTTI